MCRALGSDVSRPSYIMSIKGYDFDMEPAMDRPIDALVYVVHIDGDPCVAIRL